mgnify:CR=1 FL=1
MDLRKLKKLIDLSPLPAEGEQVGSRDIRLGQARCRRAREPGSGQVLA